MRGLTIRHLRLGSGQVLWIYIACHFVNHSLGLVSLGAAEAGLKIAAATWQSWPGTVLLYGAFGTHLTLALVGLHQRIPGGCRRWS
jgi:adenylate cyclase